MFWPDGTWFHMARPYPPISDVNGPNILELMAKQCPDGKQCTYLYFLHSSGTFIFAVALRSYRWRRNTVPHVASTPGDMGIMMIYQLARDILENARDKTVVTVFCGVNMHEDSS
jgi:NAD(P)H-flavin reductase